LSDECAEPFCQTLDGLKTFAPGHLKRSVIFIATSPDTILSLVIYDDSFSDGRYMKTMIYASLFEVKQYGKVIAVELGMPKVLTCIGVKVVVAQKLMSEFHRSIIGMVCLNLQF